MTGVVNALEPSLRLYASVLKLINEQAEQRVQLQRRQRTGVKRLL